MARLTGMFLLMIAAATPSPAFVGNVGMYSDDQGIACELHDAGGVITTYVVHKYPWDGATGSRFRIEPPDTGTWLFLTFDTPFTTVGDALTDLSVGYGTCISTTMAIGKVLWFSTVPVTQCGLVSVKPGLPSQIIITDCSFGEQSSLVAPSTVVNPTPACNCQGATEPATWGKVKALYR